MILTRLKKKPSLREQDRILNEAAKRRGLKCRKDARLTKTPYVAMHPLAAIATNSPCPPKTVTYDPKRHVALRKRVMDKRHEIIEYDGMKKDSQGKKLTKAQWWRIYQKNHKIANRKQRTIYAIKC